MTNTDYSAMSDFEINKRVAIATGHSQFCSSGWQGTQTGDFSSVIVRGPRTIGAFDPCNSPSAAWPIIQENGISLNYDGMSWQASSWRVDYSYDDWKNYPESPLRIAMILFLMMQEKGEEDDFL